MPSRAVKTLERMRNSLAGWKQVDLERVYLGHGFDVWSGSSHDIAEHPDYPWLRGTWPRHGDVAKAYVSQAIGLIEELERLQKGETDNDS